MTPDRVRILTEKSAGSIGARMTGVRLTGLAPTNRCPVAGLTSRGAKGRQVQNGQPEGHRLFIARVRSRPEPAFCTP